MPPSGVEPQPSTSHPGEPHVPRSHRSRAGLAQRLGRRAIEAVGCQAEQHSGLSSSKIITYRLARGDRISPDAEDFIAQGECDAGMTAEAVQSAMSRGVPPAAAPRPTGVPPCRNHFSCASRGMDRSRRPAAAPVRSPRWPRTSSTHSSYQSSRSWGSVWRPADGPVPAQGHQAARQGFVRRQSCRRVRRPERASARPVGVPPGGRGADRTHPSRRHGATKLVQQLQAVAARTISACPYRSISPPEATYPQWHMAGRIRLPPCCRRSFSQAGRS